MTRACAGVLMAAALAAGLALRVPRLDVAPDAPRRGEPGPEVRRVARTRRDRYDAHDHHGPTLYYLSLPAAWLRGQTTLASLDERTLRGVTVAFGAATILLLPLLSGGLGRTAVAASAILMAVSPVMVFYSRMFIQESLFACFALAFVIAVGRVAVGGGQQWPTLAGLAAGLAMATKETSVIVVPAALLACVVAWRSLPAARRPPWRGRDRDRQPSRPVAAAVAAMFFSSFFIVPAAVIEPFRAIANVPRPGDRPVEHGHPWHYYVGLLAYRSSEWPEVERGIRPRAGRRRHGRGVAHARCRCARNAPSGSRYLAGYVSSPR